MNCPACNGTVETFDVPEDLREHLPEPVPYAGLCTRCLRLHPTETGGEPTFADLESFPDSPEASVPMAIGIGRLDSLALNRSSIEALFERVEAAGADPLLILDRLAVSGSVQPAIDIGKRRHQLEQLMGTDRDARRDPQDASDDSPDARSVPGSDATTADENADE